MPDYGPRVRAARGWANLTQEELADALDREKQFVLRRELSPDHERYQRTNKGDRLAIAAVCGVPAAFIEEGFGGEARSELGERLSALEAEAREMRSELSLRALAVTAQLEALQDRVDRPRSRKQQ